MGVPRTLQVAANADYIFAGKCYRIIANELKTSPSIVDASIYMSKIADNADVNQKIYKKVVQMLDEVKKDSISYGKDPKALATAVLYRACIRKKSGQN
jgi:transcription initiation factor TFIIB